MKPSTLSRWIGRFWLIATFLFLYLPIFSLVVYSFSESEVLNDWTKFSFRWYKALAEDTEMLSGLLTSLQVAALSATGSVILGTLASYVMLRYQVFFGRRLFLGMVNAPLVMPDIVVGLSLLLAIASVKSLLGIGGAGSIYTIWIGHTLVGTAYATVVISARLRELNPQFEEAALDLGAKPFQVFYLVTLPMILQSLGAAWLLSFTLSLDDVVIAGFLSGPSSTTLSMVIFSRAQRALDPTVNALATVVIVLVTLGVVGASYLIARREKQQAKQGKG